MKISFRSPSLWISATVLSSLMYLFAFHFFPQTFPLIHLNITMDLEQALDTADVIAQKYNLGPDGYEYAAMFHTNNTVKTNRLKKNDSGFLEQLSEFFGRCEISKRYV